MSKAPVFELNNAACTLQDFNPRTEKHGKEPKPASDLRLAIDLGNEALAMFHPALKSLLYHWDEQQGGDLVDVAHKDKDKNYAPHLRMPKLKAPLQYEQEIVGARLTIHYGVSERTYIVLGGCEVNEFRITPKQGGTVSIVFRVQCHPDEAAAGKLYSLMGTSLQVTLEPPSADDLIDQAESGDKDKPK